MDSEVIEIQHNSSSDEPTVAYPKKEETEKQQININEAVVEDISDKHHFEKERKLMSHHSIGDDDSRCIFMTWKESRRMTRVHDQRLVSLHLRQILHNQPELREKKKPFPYTYLIMQLSVQIGPRHFSFPGITSIDKDLFAHLQLINKCHTLVGFSFFLRNC